MKHPSWSAQHWADLLFTPRSLASLTGATISALRNLFLTYSATPLHAFTAPNEFASTARQFLAQPAQAPLA